MAYIIKSNKITIISIVSTADGAIFGLGDDQRVYNWHHSLEHRGNWALFVNDPAEEPVPATRQQKRAQKRKN